MLLPSWDLWGLGSGSGPLGSEHQQGQGSGRWWGRGWCEAEVCGREREEVYGRTQEYSLSFAFIGAGGGSGVSDGMGGV